jgi:hypothetical protein
MKDGYGLNLIEEKCKVVELSQSAILVILSLWKKYSFQITSALVARTISKNKLIDLDWNFGVTASSDDSDHVGKTYLQLKLTIDEGDNIHKVLFLELTLEQFYKFLASMEKCRSYLDFVNPV